MFFGRTDVEAETPILWSPDVKSWLTWKDLDAGKDWGQEEKGTTEDEMVGWHHRLNGRGFGWTPGVDDGQGGLVCCGSWLAKSWTRLSDWTELNTLNWTEVTSWWPLLKCHSTPLPCFLFSHSNYCFLMLIYLFLCLLPWPEYQLQRVWFTVLSQCFKEGLAWRRITNYWFKQILCHNVCGC